MRCFRAPVFFALFALAAPALAVAQSDNGLRPITLEQRTAAFEQLVADMDRNYSYFDLKQVDWPAVQARHREKVLAAGSPNAFAGALAEMLKELKDMHIWIDFPGGRKGTHDVPWERNWSPAGIRAHLAKVEMVGRFAAVGKTKEGFGLFVMENQGAATPELAAQVVAKIEALGDVPGFIVDLRSATGGDERLAQTIASAFCAADVDYAMAKYRSGPKHTDFGPPLARKLKAGAKPFTKPVVVLIGPRAMSSGEGMVKMFAALPHAVTVGSPTRGASGNPRPVALKDVDVTVWYSRWMDLMPDGTCFEGKGIQPQIEAKFPASAFGAKDPVFEKGLEVLKAKTRG